MFNPVFLLSNFYLEPATGIAVPTFQQDFPAIAA